MFKAETTAGTRNAPVAADHNVRLFDVGDASYDVPAEPIGKLADGTFRDGPALSMDRKIGMPDCKCEFVWSGDVTVEPVFFKLMKSCGYTVELNGANPELIWQGLSDCQTLSADLNMYACGATPIAIADTARGMVGNAEIGADGPQAPIVVAFTGWMGAYLGQTDIGAAAIPPLIGYDTAAVEQMGKYAVTIAAVPYAVQSWKFNVNNEINPDGGNNAEGVAKMKITGQGARLTVTVTRLDKATDDPVQDIFDNVVSSGVTFTGGAGAHYDMTFLSADSVEVAPSDSNGTGSFDITYNVSKATFAQKV
jgi:hypothetical protein